MIRRPVAENVDEADVALLRDVGRQLFGARWQTDLALVLELSPRAVRGWAGGEAAPPPGLWGELVRLLKTRIEEQQELLRAIERRSAG